LLYANPEVIKAKVGAILEKYGAGSGHVFNLGHGILPDINPEKHQPFYFRKSLTATTFNHVCGQRPRTTGKTYQRHTTVVL
jgi:hypothetical protein